MNRTIWAIGLMLLVAAPVFAQTSVAGDWEVTINSPQGASTANMTLKQDGDKVSGVIKNQMGQLPFEGATLTGDELKFTFTVNFQGTSLPITLTGKVKATTIDGKADFGGMAEGEWSAKRVEATTAAAAPATPASPTPAAPATTMATGVSGKWDVMLRTPGGDFPATATLSVDGSKVSGTFGSQMGEVPVTGTVDGKSLKLSMTAQTPNGALDVTLTADLDGDSLVNGKADVSGMGQMEWSAKRARQ